MRAIDIKEDKEVEETDKKRKWERVLVKEFEDNLSLFISKVKHIITYIILAIKIYVFNSKHAKLRNRLFFSSHPDPRTYV